MEFLRICLWNSTVAYQHNNSKFKIYLHEIVWVHQHVGCRNWECLAICQKIHDQFIEKKGKNLPKSMQQTRDFKNKKWSHIDYDFLWGNFAVIRASDAVDHLAESLLQQVDNLQCFVLVKNNIVIIHVNNKTCIIVITNKKSNKTSSMPPTAKFGKRKEKILCLFRSVLQKRGRSACLKYAGETFFFFFGLTFRI